MGQERTLRERVFIEDGIAAELQRLVGNAEQTRAGFLGCSPNYARAWNDYRMDLAKEIERETGERIVIGSYKKIPFRFQALALNFTRRTYGPY